MENSNNAVEALNEMSGTVQALHEKIDGLEGAMEELLDIFKAAYESLNK